MLASIRIRWPSVRIAGWKRVARSRSRRRWQLRLETRAPTPAPRHRARGRGGRLRRRAWRWRRRDARGSWGPAPTTAGMPSDRAMIAVCAVGPPMTVQKPRIRRGSSLRRVRGREILGDEDHGRVGQLGRAPFGPGEQSQHPLTDVVQVGGPGSHPLVLQAPQVGDARRHDPVPGPGRASARPSMSSPTSASRSSSPEQPGARGRSPLRSCPARRGHRIVDVGQLFARGLESPAPSSRRSVAGSVLAPIRRDHARGAELEQRADRHARRRGKAADRMNACGRHPGRALSPGARAGLFVAQAALDRIAAARRARPRRRARRRGWRAPRRRPRRA